MATVCELSAVFDDRLTTLYEQLNDNIGTAVRWGTAWDIVRDVTFVTDDGATVRQLWGFTSAYARMDGMGGHVSFLVELVGMGGETEITVTATSPYEGRGKNSAYYKRNHQIALRLLEFCVAPYEDIHPRVGTLKRIADNLRVRPETNHGTA